MTFKVYHVVSNTLVFEGKCIPPMLSFLEIKICGTTVVTNSSNSIAIWKINGKRDVAAIIIVLFFINI